MLLVPTFLIDETIIDNSFVLSIAAVIFVIDSTNTERLTEAQKELANLVAEKRLQDALILIYANKQVHAFNRVFIAIWLITRSRRTKSVAIDISFL